MGFREVKLLNKGHLQIHRRTKTGVWRPLTWLLAGACSHVELQLMCALSLGLSQEHVHTWNYSSCVPSHLASHRNMFTRGTAARVCPLPGPLTGTCSHEEPQLVCALSPEAVRILPQFAIPAHIHRKRSIEHTLST